MATKKSASTSAPAKSTATKAASAKAATKTAAKKAPAVKAAPTHQEIADLAHKYFQERGGHHGSHVGDWLRAEQELKG